jgi:hypothetical protein
VAAHKPGAVPLRPLTLSDIYDAAFKIIRANPKATVGSAVIVGAFAMGIPVLVTAILTQLTELGLDPNADPFAPSSGTTAPPTSAEVLGALSPALAAILGGFLSWFGLIFVTGMTAHVSAAAAVGHRLTLGQAWSATQGKRWRLIGLSLTLALLNLIVPALAVGIVVLMVATNSPAGLIALVALMGIPISLCLMFWLWIRVLYLPVPALMLESTGVFGAIGRGFKLSRQHFWRTFGIALLTWLVTLIAGWVLALPLNMAGSFLSLGMANGAQALLVLVAAQAVGSVLSTAFTAPFASAVTSVQYLDLRIRKEGFDVELLARAGVGQR